MFEGETARSERVEPQPAPTPTPPPTQAPESAEPAAAPASQPTQETPAKPKPKATPEEEGQAPASAKVVADAMHYNVTRLIRSAGRLPFGASSVISTMIMRSDVFTDKVTKVADYFASKIGGSAGDFVSTMGKQVAALLSGRPVPSTAAKPIQAAAVAEKEKILDAIGVPDVVSAFSKATPVTAANVEKIIATARPAPSATFQQIAAAQPVAPTTQQTTGVQWPGRFQAQAAAQAPVGPQPITVSAPMGPRAFATAAPGQAAAPVPATMPAIEPRSTTPISVNVAAANVGAAPAGKAFTAAGVAPAEATKTFTAAAAPVAKETAPAVAKAAAPAAEAAGGLGGLASAALGVAGAILPIYIASKVVGAAADMAATALTTLAGGAAKLAKNEFFDVVMAAPRAYVAMLDQIPIIGGLVSAMPKVAVAFIDSVKTMTDAFISRAHEIAAVSPAIAVAEAGAEVRQLFADMREAAHLGPQMARLIDAQSRASVALQDAIEPLKQMILEQLVEYMEKFAAFVEDNKILLSAIFRELARHAKFAVGVLEGLSGGALAAAIANGFVEGHGKLEERKKAPPNAAAVWGQLFGMMGRPWGQDFDPLSDEASAWAKKEDPGAEKGFGEPWEEMKPEFDFITGR